MSNEYQKVPIKNNVSASVGDLITWNEFSTYYNMTTQTSDYSFNHARYGIIIETYMPPQEVNDYWTETYSSYGYFGIDDPEYWYYDTKWLKVLTLGDDGMPRHVYLSVEDNVYIISKAVQNKKEK
ncbi:MAG TPA: hypothetical protein DEQ32_13215 [Gammaproteobacteria bacterium]|nr:hypothetical protein [Gammaproteobacteria bacterium]|tara:strand:- start:914 stop:1288 length:375 start_codon:yes stop_codon:yes gene_type:complete